MMAHTTVARHEHGTYLAYLHDQCKCQPCTTAWNVYQQRLKSRHARGEVWADPARYRRLLAPFRTAGVSPTALFRATKVRPATARALMEGKRVRAQYAAKVDGVTWDDIDDRTLVHAALFRDLFAELTGRGLTGQAIADILGWSAWPGGDYPTEGTRVNLRLVRLLERAAGRTDHGAPSDPRCVECTAEAWGGGLYCRRCFQARTLPQTPAEVELAARRERERTAQRRRRAVRTAA